MSNKQIAIDGERRWQSIISANTIMLKNEIIGRLFILTATSIAVTTLFGCGGGGVDQVVLANATDYIQPINESKSRRRLSSVTITSPISAPPISTGFGSSTLTKTVPTTLTSTSTTPTTTPTTTTVATSTAPITVMASAAENNTYGSASLPSGLSALPLLYQQDLIHTGAFRVTNGTDTKPATFTGGGNVITYNASRNSIYIDGHSSNQYLAEVGIPENISFTDLKSLKTAPVIQGLANAMEGRLSEINLSDPNAQVAGGLLIYGDKLIIGAYSFYDANGTQSASHFIRSQDLGLNSSMSNPIKIPGILPRWVGGYMTEIPQQWKEFFGGPVLSGIAGLSIASTSSNGPSAAVIDPANLTGAIGSQVVGYPLDTSLSSLYGNTLATTNPIWNRLSQVRGIAFPDGTRSVLFFGRHGLGTVCYGTGADCGDPADSDKGYHAYPYTYQVWAYDAIDLIKVRQGQVSPNQIKPYSTWSFDLPFQENTKARSLGGVAFDKTTNRLFVSQIGGYVNGYWREPIIHVFSVR